MRKIAIITDGWRTDTNYAWIGGCRQFIQEHGLDADLYVFNSFGNFSKDEKFNLGEYNITSLPDYSKFDGVIVELTNVANTETIKKITDPIIEAGIPAVSLLEGIDGFYRAGIDNYNAMRKIVEHIVKKHGCRKLNYVGGPKKSGENKERVRAFKDVLMENGIPVEQERIVHMDYTVETGSWAFEHFNNKDLLPEAFICANDNIAVGIMHQAAANGYNVPQDFFVTGFDNFDKASYYSPRITTIGFIREQIAYDAMRILDNVWNGRENVHDNYTSVKLICQESCGCQAENPPGRGQYVIDRIFGDVRKIDMENLLMDLKRKLLECDTYAQMAEHLSICIAGLKCREMYVLMNTDLMDMDTIEVEALEDYREEYITEGYPDDMKVVYACHGNNNCRNICKSDKSLVPDLWEKEKNSLYVFSPLHFREREIGYVVLKECDYILVNHFLFEAISTFTEALEYLYNNLVLKRMNERLSLLYITDSLTGLYNRMAYDKIAIPLYKKCMEKSKKVMIMFVDADHLKYINDNFGHDMGNFAISSIATVIKQNIPADAIAMRYGGDEFVIMVPDYSDLQARVLEKKLQDEFAEYTKKFSQVFPIEASCGYVIAENGEKTINDYINEADEKMYNVKKMKKADRK